jgi:choline dehydrogenase-like flavoprotein
VIDSAFAVHGVRGLRIVDASVFPRIPGIFVAAAVYAIAEKAAETMLRDAECLRRGQSTSLHENIK